MKELVGTQVLLPAWERWSAKTGFIDGEYRGTYEHHADRVMRLCGVLRAPRATARRRRRYARARWRPPARGNCMRSAGDRARCACPAHRTSPR